METSWYTFTHPNRATHYPLYTSLCMESSRKNCKMRHTSQHPISTMCREKEFFIDNLLVRIHFIIVMMRWTGLAPWEFSTLCKYLPWEAQRETGSRPFVCCLFFITRKPGVE